MHSYPVPPELIREQVLSPLTPYWDLLLPTVFLHSANFRPQALLLALVCKESHDWISRALYRSITLSTLPALLKFDSTLTSRPALGAHIRSLYIGATVHASARTPSEFGTFTWAPACLAALRRLLTHSPHVTRLALIDLPPTHWTSLEHLLPPRLATLALGPAYGLLGLTVAHSQLKHFYYADTVLQSAELARIAQLPALTEFRWRSPLPFDGFVGEQLRVLLRSGSLKKVHVTLFGTMEEGWKAEYEELLKDGRVTIVCDPVYEGSREWIDHFHKEWRAMEA